MAGDISFSDVTDSAGLTHFGQSWGVAWGDFNNDGWPDLYDGNHREKPSFFINQKDGTFVNSVDVIFSHNEIVDHADTHGAQWVDLNNDGYKDLVVQVGSNGGASTSFLEWYNTQILMNENGQILIQKAEELDLAHPEFRGRTPLAFDYDKDGLLDILFTNMEFIGPRIFNQSSFMIFEDKSEESNLLSIENAVYAVITDFNNDNNHELLIAQQTAQILNYNVPFFEDVSTALCIDDRFGFMEYDVALGDFDGDLRTDVFKGGWDFGTTLLEQPSQDVLAFKYLWSSSPTIKEIGFSFRTIGKVTFNMEGAWVVECNSTGDSDYYFGSTGWHPQCDTYETSLILELSPNESLNQGIYNYTVDNDPGIVVVGYDPDIDLWKLVFTYEDGGLGVETPTLSGLIESENPITIIDRIGEYTERAKASSKMYYNTISGFIKTGAGIGIDQIEAGGNYVVSADFDNDEDLDIYASTTTQISNVPDVFYENIGGTFIKHEVGVDSLEGVGQTLAVADFDLDGYIDIYVTHGSGNFPFNNGAHQLLKNLGHGNNWLQIDLEGISSNRDGIGTKLILTAGGKTQIREQNGGLHRYAQNFDRIHFGLGSNEKVEKLELFWPSGITQVVTNIPANQIIRIVEKEPFPTGYKGNIDILNFGFGVYVWREFFDGPYHVRVRGKDNNPGEINNTDFTINVISDADLLFASAAESESNDVLKLKDRSFEYTSRTSQWGDGVDFDIAPGSRALFSFETELGFNPRFLYAGENRQHIAPSGWILEKELIPIFGNYTQGVTQGIVVGKIDDNASINKIRWSTREFSHNYFLWIAADEPWLSVDTSLLEADDLIEFSSNSIAITGKVKAPWEDGLYFDWLQGTMLGLSFEFDNLFQHHNVNLFQEVGFPNAYCLEPPSAFGQPIDEPGNNLTKIWREDNSNRWHFMFTAGGAESHKYYVGNITSTGNLTIVDTSTLEQQDFLTPVSENNLEFDVRVVGDWFDELVIDVEQGCNLILDFNVENLVSTIRVGGQNWKVESLPLQLAY